MGFISGGYFLGIWSERNNRIFNNLADHLNKLIMHVLLSFLTDLISFGRSREMVRQTLEQVQTAEASNNLSEEMQGTVDDNDTDGI